MRIDNRLHDSKAESVAFLFAGFLLAKLRKFLKEFWNKILRNAYDEIYYLDYHALARAFIMSSS